MHSKLWIWMVLMVTVGACKSDGGLGLKPNADAATKIAGTYDVTRLALTGRPNVSDFDESYPLTVTFNGTTITRTGLMTVTKATETTVTASVVLKTTRSTDDTLDLETLEIRNTDLYSDNVKVGTADGSSINIDTTEGTVRLVIVSKKR